MAYNHTVASGICDQYSQAHIGIENLLPNYYIHHSHMDYLYSNQFLHHNDHQCIRGNTRILAYVPFQCSSHGCKHVSYSYLSQYRIVGQSNWRNNYIWIVRYQSGDKVHDGKGLIYRDPVVTRSVILCGILYFFNICKANENRYFNITSETVLTQTAI